MISKPKFRLAPFFLVIPIMTLGAFSAHAEEKSPFITVLEGEFLGGYSQIEGRDGEFSSIDSWLFSPTIRLNDSLYWINVYNGSYNRSAQVVAQEEGGRRTDTTQTHDLSTALKYNVNETWSLRPLFFADWVFVNETEDESFGEGLYDYRDIGGGLESAWVMQKTQEKEDTLTLGFRYLDRTYPNYQSLLSLFNPNGSIETNEKDLDGYKVNLGYDSRSKDAWSWGAEGIFFYKEYTDKKTINSNGIRLSNTREDFVEYLNLFVSHPLNAEWTFALDGQMVFNQSNLDFYDTHNTLALADDNFLKNYFDYFSFLARPSLVYRRAWEGDRQFVFAADYTFYALHYPGRKVQNVSGVYQADDQQDYAHTFSAKVNVPITKNVSWVVYGNYSIADSNQKFESFYLYEYNLWTAVTGISVKY